MEAGDGCHPGRRGPDDERGDRRAGHRRTHHRHRKDPRRGRSRLPGQLLEIWQANASGRYIHWRETEFPAPLDPNFLGVGWCKTGAEGRHRFQTIKPGPYPWGNHPIAWRPAHIDVSLLGPNLGSRLVTQLYFPGDLLQPLDPIFNSTPEHARDRLIATYDHDVTEENWAAGYRRSWQPPGPINLTS